MKTRLSLTLFACIVSFSFLTAQTAEDVFGQSDNLGNGWIDSPWFGPVHVTEFPYVYVEKLGWGFIDQDSNQDTWLYDLQLGWLQTKPGLYPHLYRADSETWLLRNHDATLYDYALRRSLADGETPPARVARYHSILWRASKRIDRTITEINRKDRYPISTQQDKWVTVGSSNWTSGFFPTILWKIYEFTGNVMYQARAQQWMRALEAEQHNMSTHDLGMMVGYPFQLGYELTGNLLYKAVLEQAAASLATRYNSRVGGLRSWSWGSWDDHGNFTIIIDNMINLELLFRAAELGPDPQLAEIAVKHADTSFAYHVRPDFSTFHAAIFDQATGDLRERRTHQGYSDDSTWARGQAWAIYGFTMVYRETGEERFREYAAALADFYLDHLPSDIIPFWDFFHPAIPYTSRDTSAAAIAASGLLELAQLSDGADATRYHNAAIAMLDVLCTPAYFGNDNGSNALLGSATYNFPAGNHDTAVIWGDYFFIEALMRYLSTQETTLQ